VLLQPVGKALHMMGFEKTVEAVDDFPFEVTHCLSIEPPVQKTIW
jgi:hypothetical protein